MNSSSLVRVGAFFFVALVLAGFFTVTVGNLRLLRKGMDLWVVFENVEGLKEGDTVRVSGLKLGRVEELVLEEARVRAQFRLDLPVTFYEDYMIRVIESTIVGGRYVEILLGTPGKPKVDTKQPLRGTAVTSPVTAVGDFFETNQPKIESIAKNLEQITDKAARGEGTLGRLVNDPALYDEAKQTFGNLSQAASEIQEMGERVNRSDGTIGKLISSDELYQDFRNFVSELREVVAPLEEASQKIQRGEGTIGKLVQDEGLYQDTRAVIGDLKEAASSLKNVLGGLERGEGTAGKLLKEEDLYNRATESLESLDETLGRAARTRLFLGVDHAAFGQTDASFSRVYLRLEPRHDRFFHVGAAWQSLDADSRRIQFEDQVRKGDNQSFVRPEVLLGYRFWEDRLTLRAGILEGRAGGGLEARVGVPWIDQEVTFGVEARDAYNSVDDEDIDEDAALITRAYVGTRFLKYFSARAGVNRLGNDPEFFLGISFEYEDEDLRSLIGVLGLTR